MLGVEDGGGGGGGEGSSCGFLLVLRGGSLAGELVVEQPCSLAVSPQLYGRLYRVVEPKRARMNAALSQLQEKQAALAEAQEKLRELRLPPTLCPGKAKATAEGYKALRAWPTGALPEADLGASGLSHGLWRWALSYIN
ncbi:hypothetical protein MC885_018366 [Smutsia gigantea]|nr:hypothetical protein MC885_018366 [Smutsia gigantea]